jgi:hypothetical protein
VRRAGAVLLLAAAGLAGPAQANPITAAVTDDPYDRCKKVTLYNNSPGNLEVTVDYIYTGMWKHSSPPSRTEHRWQHTAVVPANGSHNWPLGSGVVDCGQHYDFNYHVRWVDREGAMREQARLQREEADRTTREVIRRQLEHNEQVRRQNEEFQRRQQAEVDARRQREEQREADRQASRQRMQEMQRQSELQRQQAAERAREQARQSERDRQAWIEQQQQRLAADRQRQADAEAQRLQQQQLQQQRDAADRQNRLQAMLANNCGYGDNGLPEPAIPAGTSDADRQRILQQHRARVQQRQAENQQISQACQQHLLARRSQQQQLQAQQQQQQLLQQQQLQAEQEAQQRAQIQALANEQLRTTVQEGQAANREAQQYNRGLQDDNEALRRALGQ